MTSMVAMEELCFVSLHLSQLIVTQTQHFIITKSGMMKELYILIIHLISCLLVSQESPSRIIKLVMVLVELFRVTLHLKFSDSSIAAFIGNKAADDGEAVHCKTEHAILFR